MNIDCLFAQDEERTPARTRHIKRTVAGMGEGENRGAFDCDSDFESRRTSTHNNHSVLYTRIHMHTHAQTHRHAHMVCGQEKASAVEVRRRG